LLTSGNRQDAADPPADLGAAIPSSLSMLRLCSPNWNESSRAPLFATASGQPNAVPLSGKSTAVTNHVASPDGSQAADYVVTVE
jgi:hypothetical protein